VAVKKIIVNGSNPEIAGETMICFPGSITLRAVPDPENVSFPDGSPVWEITEKPEGSELANPPAGSATAVIAPDVPGQYKIKASCGTSSQTFTLKAVKVEITDGQGTVIDQLQTTVVGKKIVLKRKLTPTVTPDEQSWEVGGSAIKDYTQSNELGKRHPLEDSDLHGDEVQFYWIAAGTSIAVTYTAKFGGRQCSAVVTL
jgi:hypothetical protein